MSAAVHSIAWSSNPGSYRAIFLVGDAPPHMDYQDDVKYPQTVAAALNKGIVVNTIQCGGETETLSVWRQIVQLSAGAYFQVEQGGSAIAIATPTRANSGASTMNPSKAPHTSMARLERFIGGACRPRQGPRRSHHQRRPRSIEG